MASVEVVRFFMGLVMVFDSTTMSSMEIGPIIRKPRRKFSFVPDAILFIVPLSSVLLLFMSSM